MQLKTILNRVEKQKGFVYSEARMTKTGQIEFTLQPRRGSKPICGNCGKKGAKREFPGHAAKISKLIRIESSWPPGQSD